MPRKPKEIHGQLADINPLSEQDKRERLWERLCEGLLPPEKLDLDEWSDLYRKLPSTTSSEPGQWRTSRFPFLKRIMKCLSPSNIAREVVIMKGAQLGFTEICISWILYIADMDPGPVMYVQKTIDAAEDFSTQKLTPNIEECKRIERLLGALKSKSLTDETLNKGFPGGFVVMGGANSGAFLRSKSIKYGMADEEDSYKANIDGEGSPVGMIRKRMANFPFSKFFRLSTPKFTETSTIEPAFRQGSQEQYYCPCPHCNKELNEGGTWLTIKWGNIKWGKELDEAGLPREIWLECEACGGKIPEHKKTWMLENGRWMSEKGSPGKPYEVGDVELPSFQISSLYSPLGFFSWRDAIKEWYEYLENKDQALLQVFINQTLGETYSLTGQEISTNWLMERREEYIAPVPANCLCLTAGVDVQEDRLEFEIVGWGLNGESWSIDYRVLWGNPDYLGDDFGKDHTGQSTVWKLLDEYLQVPYRREDGRELLVECAAIDSQHKTEIVQTFCRYREHRRIFPIMGKDGWGKGYIQRPNKRSEKYKTWVYTMWVDELKNRTYSALKIDKPGPGYCHFPKRDNYDSKHFKQLTSETKRTEIKNGKKKMIWYLPSGARNEQLDCRNYATGAFLIFAPNLEFRAQQIGLGSAPEVVAVGAEASNLHLENRVLHNNPRQMQAPKPLKIVKRTRRNLPGIW